MAEKSIFNSIIRSFLSAFFSIIGALVAFLLIIFIFSAIFSAGVGKTLPSVSHIVAPDADNVRTPLRATSPLILEIDIKGFIGGEFLSKKTVKEQLLSSQEDMFQGRIKAIFLNIHSGGGTVYDADSIYRMLLDYKKRYNVPIYAYVDGTCASGALYIASAADKIYASSVSFIGSVGVRSPFMNFTGTLEKIGAKSLTLTAGKGKDTLNPLREWAEGEEAEMQRHIDFYYDRFVGIVTGARSTLDREKLINEYGARVFPAVEALSYGFIDVAGAERIDALRDLVQLAQIEENYQVITLSYSRGLIHLFKSQTKLFGGKLEHELKMPGINSEMLNKPLYLYAPFSNE